MENKVKILAFAGSTRKDSFNKKLVKLAAKAAEDEGAEVTIVDLKDYPMPLYDGDDEAAGGLPPKALEFKRLMEQSDGFIIASPEYNSGYSAVLKNAFDWASRKDEGGSGPLTAFNGKYAALLSASPGQLGGLRGLYQLREVLLNVNVTVMPQMQAVKEAHNAFDENGQLKDEKMAKSVAGIGANLVKTLKKLKP